MSEMMDGVGDVMSDGNGVDENLTNAGRKEYNGGWGSSAGQSR